MTLDRGTLDELDDRYVRSCDCADRRQEIALREAALDKAVARLDTKLSWLVGILGAVGVAVLTIAVKILFGG